MCFVRLVVALPHLGEADRVRTVTPSPDGQAPKAVTSCPSSPEEFQEPQFLGVPPQFASIKRVALDAEGSTDPAFLLIPSSCSGRGRR